MGPTMSERGVTSVMRSPRATSVPAAGDWSTIVFSSTPSMSRVVTFTSNPSRSSPMLVARAFLPAMLEAGGPRKIVNVASTAGYAPAPNMSAYAASKHAVIGLSEVLALELHDRPVSVMIVCPGIINTPLIGTTAHAPGISQAQIEKLSRYYVEEGCHPSVVAAGIVRGIERDAILLPVGPMASLAHWMTRLSRRLARRLLVDGAKRSGYLP